MNKKAARPLGVWRLALFWFAVERERIVDDCARTALAVKILRFPKSRPKDDLGFEKYLRPRGAGQDERISFCLRNRLQEALEIRFDDDDRRIDRCFEVELSNLEFGDTTAAIHDFVVKT